MVNEKDIELIESYLEGQLSPQERAAVEERLGSDPKFAGQCCRIFRRFYRVLLRWCFPRLAQRQRVKIRVENSLGFSFGRFVLAWINFY